MASYTDISTLPGFPFLERVYATAAWAPGEILMGLTPEAFDRFQAGEHEELSALNSLYLSLMFIHPRPNSTV